MLTEESLWCQLVMIAMDKKRFYYFKSSILLNKKPRLVLCILHCHFRGNKNPNIITIVHYHYYFQCLLYTFEK